jgi:hypothetical protein
MMPQNSPTIRNANDPLKGFAEVQIQELPSSAIRSNLPVSREIGRDDAIRASVVACRRLKMPLPSRLRVLTRLSSGYGRNPEHLWEVRLVDNGVSVEQSGGGYEVKLIAADGQLSSFKNSKREWERIRGIGRSGKPTITMEAQAKPLLLEIGNRAGLPKGATLKPINRQQWNERGVIFATFTLTTPGGYPYAGQAPLMSVSLDPKDGELMEIRQEWRFRFEATQQRVSRSAAIAAATQQVRAIVQGDNARYVRLGRNMQRAELRYAVPNRSRVVNGLYVEDQGTITYPQSLRLAWVVRFGLPELNLRGMDAHTMPDFAEVCIDAGNGAPIAMRLVTRNMYWKSS